MEIRFIRASDIDDRKWDACIRHSVNTRIYAYSWYLNLVCDHWDALVDGDYEQVFPLPYRKKAGISYIYTPPFTQQLGLFSPGHITPDSVEAFLNAIPKGFRIVDLNLNTLNKMGTGRPWEQHRNYELDLTPGYQRIGVAYSENLRRNIRKAEIAGMECVENVSPAELIQLFRQNRGHSIQNLGDKEYTILERLAHALLHRGMASLTAAMAGGNRLLAGALISELPNQSTFLFSATERREENHGALAWLIDRYLRDHAGEARFFDFEGSDNPGLARFYAGFGARETSYPAIRLNTLPEPLRLVLKMYRKYQGR